MRLVLGLLLVLGVLVLGAGLWVAYGGGLETIKSLAGLDIDAWWRANAHPDLVRFVDTNGQLIVGVVGALGAFIGLIASVKGLFGSDGPVVVDPPAEVGREASIAKLIELNVIDAAEGRRMLGFADRIENREEKAAFEQAIEAKAERAEAQAEAGETPSQGADAEFLRLFADGKAEEAFATLLAPHAANQAGEASKFREAGALFMAAQPALALEAYRRAASLEPGDFGTQVFLARLAGALGRWDEAKAAVDAAAASASGPRERSVALDEAGAQAGIHGSLADARGAYEESLGIRRELASELKTPESRRDLSVSLDNLGDAIGKLEGPEGSRPLHEESLGIRRALASELKTPEARRDLSVSLNKLGDTIGELEGPEGSRPLYEESLGIARALASELKTPEARRDLSVSLNKLGDTIGELEGPEGSRPLYEESLEIARALASELKTPEARRDVSVSLEKLGDTIWKLEGPEGSRPLHEESLGIRRALASELKTPEARRDVVVSCHRMAGVLAQLGQREQAVMFAREGLEGARAYAAQVGDIPDARSLVGAMEELLAQLEQAQAEG